ncbi:MAG: CBS domain-containing protein [Elusimicrobia bacterium]|nr:CBS domain-containing protein [Elusimicrobiota bacterium]
MKCPDCGHENLAGEEACEACHTPLASLSIPNASRGKDQRRILEGTVEDLHSHDALMLDPDRSVADAVRLMRGNKMGCVLVASHGDLCGIFTERDLLSQVAGLEKPEKTRLAEVMRANPQCLKEDDAVALAFHAMAVNGHRHVPIRRRDGTLGVISSRDLLDYLCR